MNTCICTIIKNEREYLEDWLKYNIGLGITKIYIIEDEGSESHKDITDKYPEVEILDIKYDEEKAKKNFHRVRQSYFQTEMFNYIKSLNIYDWCFIIDIDEYITLTEDISLQDFLSEYSEYSELMLYWKNYGASGHITKPDYSKVNSYREYYTKPCGYSNMDLKYSYFMKKGINLHKISPNYKVNMHYHSMATYIKTDFQKGIHTPCFKRAYLAHYITRSWEEYIWKLLKRGMCCDNHRKIDDFFEMNRDLLPMKDELLKMIDEKVQS